MIVYVSGPITGVPDGNRPAFAAACAHLERLGHQPINPHDLHHGATDLSWHAHMRRDLAVMLARADAIATLDGWGASEGACLEVEIARHVAIPVWRLHDVPSAVGSPT